MTRRREGGFSLVEATIVVAVLAMAAAIVLPAMSNVTRAELRESAGRVAGTLRATYDRAALTGELHRVVFDLEKARVSVEARAAAGGGSQLAGLAGLLAGAGAKDPDAAPIEVQPPAELMAVFGVVPEDADDDESAAQARSGFTSAGSDVALKDGVRVMDVWTEGMSQPVAEGQVFLTFFPHGYTENAVVHLSDDDSNVITLKIAGLTGQVEIISGYVEAGK